MKSVNNNKSDDKSIIEKVKKYGYDFLTSEEKLQLALELIGYNGKNSDFTSIHEFFDAPEHQLKEFLSKTQFVKFNALRELQAQYLQEEIMKSEKALSSPEEVKDFLISKIGANSNESLICIYVDSKNKYIDCTTLSTGTVNQVIIYPREIIKKALLVDATGIIIAHNHPSGIPDPSGADIRLTEQVKTGAEALGINVLDHLIVGRNQYFSFLEEGLLEDKADYKILFDKTHKEINLDETIPLNKTTLRDTKSIKETFLQGLRNNKEDQIKGLNKQLKQILGYEKLDIKHLPILIDAIDNIFNAFESQYSDTGYINLEKINEKDLNKLLKKEAYSFFERYMLEEKERKKFENIIPDPGTRKDLFAEYSKKRNIDLSSYTHTESNFILRMFGKIYKGIEKIIGRKTELEKLFLDFTNGCLELAPVKLFENNIVESKDLYKYKNLKGIDVISGDVNFSEFNYSDLGDVNKITGKAVFSNSKITSLGKLETVGSLDLRDSRVSDLGELERVKTNVYSNDIIKFSKWQNVSVGKDIFSFGAKMTKAYYKLIEPKNAREKQKEKNIDVLTMDL